MADGGEGTTEALVSATGGRVMRVFAMGPLSDGGNVEGRIGLLGDGATAVVEMACVSGLPLVPPEKRNPLFTTTYGTGQLIAAALDRGVKRLIVGIGGSATTDCGAGAAQAIGVRFLDGNGLEIRQPMTGELLAKVAGVEFSGRHAGVAGCRIEAACDVDNPLLGRRGAAAVYGPQKGASPADVGVLERNLEHFIGVVEASLGRGFRDVPGAGAAGGLGAGLMAFLGAQLRRGVDIVLSACGLAEKLQGADLVLTGEGQIDGQTLHGKTISGVARIARSAGVPCIVLAGRLGPGVEELDRLGLKAIHVITPASMPLAEAMAGAGRFMADAAERVMMDLLAGR
jgi:glycerate kinase